jgi:hypothetical protein
MTGKLAAKIVAACLFGVLTLYYLNKGKAEHDFEKLVLAAVCGLLTAAVFVF